MLKNFFRRSQSRNSRKMHKIIILSLIFPLISCSLHSHKIPSIDGGTINFADFKGKTLLLTNTASQCSQTDAHYKSLKRLHDILSFGDKFDIVAFPCNDFGEQEPWEAKEISEFLRSHFKIEFHVTEKVKIVGSEKHPIWEYIIETSNTPPSWNFHKYLFDGDGNFVKSWPAETSVEEIFTTVKETIGKVNNVKQEL